MRVNLNFYVDVSENFTVDELKQFIIDTFKEDFEVIFQGRKIKPGRELNKLNVLKDSKLFLMFSKLKASKVKSSIFTPNASERFIGFNKKSDSTNTDFKKISNDKNNELNEANNKDKPMPSQMAAPKMQNISNKGLNKIEVNQEDKKSSLHAAPIPQTSEINELEIDEEDASKMQNISNKGLNKTEINQEEKEPSLDASKTQISEIDELEIDEGDVIQSNNQNYQMKHPILKQAAEQWVNNMLGNSDYKDVVIEIGKDPLFFDKFAKLMIQEYPKLEQFLSTYKYEIIQSCKEKLAELVSNTEEIEQVPDRNTNEFYHKTIEELIRSGESDKALDLSNKALKNSPLDGRLHSFKVAALIDLKKFDEAFDAYNDAINSNSFPTNLYLWRGSVLYAMHKKTEALAVVSEGVTIYPNEVELLVLKGKILYDLKEREEAIRYFITASRVNGNYSAAHFKTTFPDANEIFVDRFPGFSIKKGLECNICGSKFDKNDTQYLCLYCEEPNHYHCDSCEKIINTNAEGSAKFAHPHSTFIIHPSARKLNKLKFGASTHENIEYTSDQEDKAFTCFCDNSNAGYCDKNANVSGIRYKCAHCLDFDLCEGCQVKFVDGEAKTINCLKSSGHKSWHVMIKMKIP